MADHQPCGGCLADTAYPSTYIRELSPAWLCYAAIINGASPRPLDGSFRYLELGCGQGLSTIMHAAAFPRAEFHACDVDALCIESAERLAARLSVDNVTFHRAPFTDLLEMDLPRFDFVAAHGVYSWVDETTRASLRRLIDTRLAPAGLAYLSYNCMPGWAAEIPLRRLMIELAASSSGSASMRAQEAARTLHGLGAAGSAYFRLNPESSRAVDAYLQSPASYLAHEFLNGAWAPSFSVDVADEMAGVGLHLLGSATLPDNHQALLVDDSIAGVIAALPTERQRRLAMDFAVHRRFRRDLFARPMALDVGTADGGAAALTIGCLHDPACIAETIQVPRGSMTFDRAFIDELRAAIVRGSATLAALGTTLAREFPDRPRILRNLLYLVAAGELVPFARECAFSELSRQPDFPSAVAREMVIRVARSGGSGWIASEITGGGVRMDHLEAKAVVDFVQERQPMKLVPSVQIQRLVRLGILV